MNALVKPPTNMGQMSAHFAGQPVADDLGAGVQGGFGRVGFKGKVWSIHWAGEAHQLLRNDGSGDPLGSIEVVILKASTHVSKTWYETGFVEGSTAAPDCLSANGITPDPNSPKKQSATCATCPRNAWGSQIKQDGTAGKGKACSDVKRLAVVPLADIPNEMFGGPLLLRVPAASLQDVASYGKGVAKLGYHYYAVATRIGFDAKEAFPKLTFSPIRALTDAEAAMVIQMRDDPSVDRILAEDTPIAAPTAPAPATPDMQFEQPVTAPQTTTASPQTTTRAPTTTAFGGTPAVGAAGVATPAPTAAATTTKSARTPRAPKPAAPAQVANTSADPSPTAPGDDDFNAALDAELDNLMGG